MVEAAIALAAFEMVQPMFVNWMNLSRHHPHQFTRHVLPRCADRLPAPPPQSRATCEDRWHASGLLQINSYVLVVSSEPEFTGFKAYLKGQAPGLLFIATPRLSR
jgi:hypothetical protein